MPPALRRCVAWASRASSRARSTRDRRAESRGSSVPLGSRWKSLPGRRARLTSLRGRLKNEETARDAGWKRPTDGWRSPAGSDLPARGGWKSSAEGAGSDRRRWKRRATAEKWRPDGWKWLAGARAVAFCQWETTAWRLETAARRMARTAGARGSAHGTPGSARGTRGSAHGPRAEGSRALTAPERRARREEARCGGPSPLGSATDGSVGDASALARAACGQGAAGQRGARPLGHRGAAARAPDRDGAAGAGPEGGAGRDAHGGARSRRAEPGAGRRAARGRR